jgi:TPR repeat protein
VLGSVPLPAVPAPSPALAEGGVLHLDIDSDVLVAYDAAKSLDARGRDRPDETAAAWRAVADAGGAANPLRDMAAARARQWQDYADGTRAFEAQLARDTDRLRKVLPLGSVTDSTKQELLVRYAAAYGEDRAAPLVDLLPSPALRERARLAVGCEGRTAASCVALARGADDSHDAKGALGYLARACELDDAGACAEAGERWLQAPVRDVSRAVVALQRGCAVGGATACARLARLYEDGDGTPANPALATAMRDKACAAGDGNSCRRLACAVDANASAGEQARANELWQKGCANGDAASCAVANAARNGDGSFVAKQVEQAAAAGTANAAVQTPNGEPASVTSAPAPVASLSSSAQARATFDRMSRTGFMLIGIGAVAMGGAAFMAVQDDSPGGFHGPRGLYGEDRYSHAGFAVVLGALGLMSAGTGVAVLLSRPDPSGSQVGIGVAPGRLMLSGKTP